MSETNGNGAAPDANTDGMSRILSIKQGTAPKHALTRAQRAEVERIAYDLVIQECAAVHEFYLKQVPTFVARMIQDALLTYGLIQPLPGVDIAPATDTTSPKSGTDDGHVEGLPADGLGDGVTSPPAEPAA